MINTSILKTTITFQGRIAPVALTRLQEVRDANEKIPRTKGAAGRGLCFAVQNPARPFQRPHGDMRQGQKELRTFLALRIYK